MDARLVYLNHDSFPVAAGVGEFNPSFVSSDTSLITGVLFATDFSRFLSDPLVSHPTAAVNPGSCSNDGTRAADRVSSYFLSGGLKSISPWPSLKDTLPGSPLYTVSRSSGYQFDFSAIDPAARFDGTKDCNMYGEASTAVQFCLAVSNDSLLNMSELCGVRVTIDRDADFLEWNNCPLEIGSNSSCLTDASWLSSTGFTASMRPYRRTATVHYYRYNFTIHSIENLGSAQLVKLDPQDLFLVYNSTFTSSGNFGDFGDFGDSLPGSPFIAYLNTYMGLSQTSSQSTSIALLSLRNLAVLPLYYFQANYLNPALDLSPNAPAGGLPDELYTTASFTDPSYRLVVNRITLYIYTIGGTLVLALCTVAMILGSLKTTADNIPNMSVWAVVGLPINCLDSTRDSHESNLHIRLQQCHGTTGSQLLGKLKDIRLFTTTDRTL